METPAGSSLLPATICSVTDGTANSDFIKTTLPYLFGEIPYVVVKAYLAYINITCTGMVATTVDSM
ncbi:hypothetical protein GN244_ATG16742 [Phytophthora infestans]|uniref:Uncharacterized protein n=1 Tax=Phytophthora infestans TaxID=4787 RepID=A0A833SI68_PHYIN|nr:hypothetical protein GN244_ATG16742 [Phytophthora infestans]